MKKNISILIIGSILLLGCTKSKTSTPDAISQWTFNGNTYSSSNAAYNTSSNEILANDGNGNFVRIFFSSIGKPTASGTLTVLNYATAFSNSSQCSLQVGNLYGTNPIQPLSTGKAGDKVLLDVSSLGKLTVSFATISVLDGTVTKTVSGTIVEQ